MSMKVWYGKSTDIESWMKLVKKVSWNFPGLETEDKIEEHRQTILRFMSDKQAICMKDENEIVGVMLFSKKYNMICCLAVDPEYRRKGIASALLSAAITELDRTKDITVSTFRMNDQKGDAPRALYTKHGFVEDKLIEEFGYPSQLFILHP